VRSPGFKPQACRVRRPQTKGKVERRFFYVETSLLNGRSFDTLEHLNEVTARWLQEVADARVLRDFQESPGQRHQREQPHLLPLPACDFDTAPVAYRHVNVEGFVTQRLNFYSVPWSYIGQLLPVRVTESEVIIYSIGLDEIARHRLLPRSVTGTRQVHASHHPTDDPAQRTLLLRQRFSELGPVAVQFLDGLLAKQIQGKLQAQQLLALVAHYQRDDVLAALERAVHDRVRFYARFELLIIDEFGLDRIERSLCAQAASLWYKIIDARNQRVSTALVTNIDFEKWAEYLGDHYLAMAMLDRVVDGATIVRLKGKSTACIVAPTHRPQRECVRRSRISSAPLASPGNSSWPQSTPRNWPSFKPRSTSTIAGKAAVPPTAREQTAQP
jgi:hypothetical protein